MSTEDYSVRLEAIDSGFSDTINKAIDLLTKVEPATKKAASTIDSLERSLAGVASKGQATQGGLMGIAGQLQMVKKHGGLSAEEIKQLNAALGQLNSLGNQRLAVVDQLKQAEKAANAASEAIAKVNNTHPVAASVNQYNSMRPNASASSTAGAVNQQFPLLKQQLAEIDKLDKANYDAAVGRIVNRTAAEERARSQELGSLRSAIQQRAVIEDRQAERSRNLITGQTQEAERLRQAELASLRANIQERAAADVAAEKAARGTTESLSNQRYVLYDVAATWTAVSAATIGAAAAATKTAMDYEAAGASVQRTSGAVGQQWDDLYSNLINLSTAIPESFQDIAGIATLGGQLGVAAEDIEDFTETVVKFAATTDVTTEKSAEGIGRVAQLTGTAASEYENLAASIYEVGVNSVATESAILSTATQISTAGDLAGFTNHEIVALAGAFASLNIAPERSRGSVQRIFGEIDAAVSEGGEALEAFAQTSGTTASEFAQAWQNAPQTAFNAFLQGLHSIQEAGGDTNAALKDLGIGAVRDIQALQALANNMEVYTNAQTDASTAFREGTAVADGYAIVADTLSAKVTLLQNSFKALMASAGDNEALKTIVDLLANVLNTINQFASTPLGGFISSAVVGMAALVGTIAAVRAAAALARASLIGLQQANTLLSASQSGASLSGKALLTELTKLGVGQRTAAAAANAHTAALRAQSAAAAQGAGSLRAAAAGASAGASSLRGATAATGLLATGLKGLVRAAGPVGLIWGAFEGISFISDRVKSMDQRVKEFSGNLSDLRSALQQDTKVYQDTGEAFSTFSVEVESSKSSLQGWAQPLQALAGDQATLASNAYETTEAIEKQTIAIGENTAAALAARITSDDGDNGFMAVYQQNVDGLKQLGFEVDVFFRKITEGGTSAADYLNSLEEAINKQRQALLEAQYAAEESMNGDAMAKAQADVLAFEASVSQINPALQAMREQNALLGGTIQAAAQEGEIAAGVYEGLGIELDETGQIASDAATGIEENTESLKDLVDSAFSAISATASMNDAIANLGSQMAENGPTFSIDTAEGIDNLNALESAVSSMAAAAGDDYQTFALQLADLMSALQSQGVDLTNEAAFMGDILSQAFDRGYGINVDPSAALTNIGAVINAAIAAAQALAVIEKTKFNNSVSIANALKATPFGSKVKVPTNTAAITSAENEVAALSKLRDGMNQTTASSKALERGYNDRAKAANKSTGAGKKNNKATRGAGKAAKEAAEEFRTFADYANEVSSIFNRAFEFRFSVQNAQDALEEAFSNLKTTASASIDLDFSFGTSFAEAFARSNAQDAVTRQFYDLQDAADAAKKAVRDAQQALTELYAKMGSLESERDKLLRQIAVSEMYGDAARVSEGKAKLADLDAQISAARNDLTDARKDLSNAQSDASRVTGGNSPAAIQNRKDLQALVSTHMDYLDALVKSGASQATMDSAIDNAIRQLRAQSKALGFVESDIAAYLSEVGALRKEYGTAAKAAGGYETSLGGMSESARENRAAFQGVVDQIKTTAQAMLNAGVPANEVNRWLDEQIKRLEKEATQLGFTRNEVNKYTGAVRDLQTIIKSIPPKVSSQVNFSTNVSAVDKALGEFWAKKQYEARVAARTVEAAGAGNAADNLIRRYNNARVQIPVSLVASGDKVGVSVGATGGGAAGRNYYMFAAGGFTGRGGKYDVAGEVHRGEYVIPQEGVDQSRGLPKPDYLASLFVPQQSMAQPAPRGSNKSGNAIQLVELLPGQLAQLAAAVSTTLNLDGKALASTVNKHNKNTSSRGAA